jgi:hypothetical protein
VAEDAYGADHAGFVLLVDGEQFGDIHTVTARHGIDPYQLVAIDGDFSGAETIGVQFVNDLYNGSPSEDRNLYVDALILNRVEYQGEDAANPAGPNLAGDAAALYNSNGPLVFDLVHA